jgi:hypothetical protein
VETTDRALSHFDLPPKPEQDEEHQGVAQRDENQQGPEQPRLQDRPDTTPLAIADRGSHVDIRD